MTTSARGLSFCSMTFSRMPTTADVPRTVSVFWALFGEITGWIGMPGRRRIWLRIWATSVASAFER